MDDEYGDGLAERHPAMLLHLLLRGCDVYTEADDFLVWCKEQFLDPASIHAREMYFELRDAAPEILKLFGTKVKPISAWNYELATGATRALRELKRSDTV